ncbi:MAG: GlsB/YeaQ/YmgE family stress response membrane protein [Bacteroidota bacterium]
MAGESILYILLVGAIIGWLAGQLMKGRGFGLIGNIVIGILGSFIGNWLASTFNFSIGTGMVNTIATGVIGAAVLVFAIGLIRGK